MDDKLWQTDKTLTDRINEIAGSPFEQLGRKYSDDAGWVSPTYSLSQEVGSTTASNFKFAENSKDSAPLINFAEAVIRERQNQSRSRVDLGDDWTPSTVKTWPEGEVARFGGD